MNKYEEALDDIANKINGNYIPDVSKQIDILQELVKRATPTKPIKDAFDCYKCPNCGEFKLVCSFDNYGYCDTKLDYCHDCGQCIDWGDK